MGSEEIQNHIKHIAVGYSLWVVLPPPVSGISIASRALLCGCGMTGDLHKHSQISHVTTEYVAEHRMVLENRVHVLDSAPNKLKIFVVNLLPHQ